jgi:hypothetical protein
LKTDEKVLNWLLEPDQPIVRYFTLQDLLDRKESDSEVVEAHSEILNQGWAHDILESQNPDGSWESAADLYRPKYSATNWKMIVLSDFALKHEDDRRLEKGCQLFFADWLKDEDVFEADGEICVHGNLARTLTKFGFGEDPRVQRLYRWIISAQKSDGGWHCFKSDKGTLDCWEGLAAYSALPKSKRGRSIKKSIERGAEFYLERSLYKEGRKYSPWFRFHYPNHYYYDILVGMDILTSLGYGGDKCLGPALALLKKKRLTNGTWALDSIHPDLGEGADYELKGRVIRFALESKGKPSKWITLKALQVLKRVDEAE